ncbi:MAG: hypothetical protein KBH99_07500 [Syntrophobacteraceae bacterium]|nr:hypothetical protein [Syntrophobacteraceae bacterium]
MKEAGITTYEQLRISSQTYDYILSDIRNITSRRRTQPTDFLGRTTTPMDIE